MSQNYKFHNPDGVYFINFTVVEWLDNFVIQAGIHNNPVEEDLVFRAQDYRYGRALITPEKREF